MSTFKEKMIEYGHIDITKEDLDSLDFKDEVICYKQIPFLGKKNLI